MNSLVFFFFIYTFVIPCLTNALCEYVSAGGLCTTYQHSLPFIATHGYRWRTSYLRVQMLLLSPDWVTNTFWVDMWELVQRGRQLGGKTKIWKVMQLSCSMFTVRSVLSPILLSELVRVGFTFMSKTKNLGLYECMRYILIHSAWPRTGWRHFQACYFGHGAVAAFQQIKGYEQRDPAAQKLQI